MSLAMSEIKMKSDRFKKAREGESRRLHLACRKCGEFVVDYQKDGSGALKHLYLDRIIDGVHDYKNLVCKNCGQLLGTPMMYKPEQRAAYRLVPGTVKKTIVTSDRH